MSTYFITTIHVVLYVILMVSFCMASCKNPGFLKKEDDERLNIMNLLQMIHPDDICPRCQVLTTPRSQHCNICDKCVEGWDHHCPWLNNCVGTKNRNSFFVFLISLTLLTLFNIEPPITAMAMQEKDETRPPYADFCVGCTDWRVMIPIFAI